jgi:hypothetical protein
VAEGQAADAGVIYLAWVKRGTLKVA